MEDFKYKSGNMIVAEFVEILSMEETLPIYEIPVA